MFWVRKSKSATVATVTGVGDEATEGLSAGSELFCCCCWKKVSSSREEMLERGSRSSCMGSTLVPPGSSDEPTLQPAVLKSKDWADRPLLLGVNTWSGLERVSGDCRPRLSCPVLVLRTRVSWVCSELSCCRTDHASASLERKKDKEG